MRKRITPIGLSTRGLVAITLFLGMFGAGLATGNTYLFRSSYLLAFLLIMGFLWTWANVRGVQATMSKTVHRCQVGMPFEETFTLRNVAKLPKLWLEVTRSSDMFGYSSSMITNMEGGEQKKWSHRSICTRRGYYRLDPLKIKSTDPFELFEQERILGPGSNLIVHPALANLSTFLWPAKELMGAIRRAKPTYFITPRATTVREYAPQDSLNRIHWPTTARMGKIMVKEFELDPANDLWILLDMERAVQAGDGIESTEEYGVTIAGSLAKRFLDMDYAVGFIAYGESTHVFPKDRGTGQFLRIMDCLAGIKAAGVTPLVEALATHDPQFARNTTLIVISSSPQDSWVPLTLPLIERGVKLMIVLIEPGTFGGDASSLLVFSSLAAAGVPTCLIRKGDPLDRALRLEVRELR
ncbi:MAG: DUF58 domain-containing protein [Chloroflexi bacterium]|nr:DUF58 domain-containing protein [Chloroflexota bacterium]